MRSKTIIQPEHRKPAKWQCPECGRIYFFPPDDRVEAICGQPYCTGKLKILLTPPPQPRDN